MADGVTPDELDGLVKDVCQGASKHAREVGGAWTLRRDRGPFVGGADTSVCLLRTFTNCYSGHYKHQHQDRYQF